MRIDLSAANSFVQAQTSAKLTSSVNAIIDGDILSNGLVEILANNGALNTGANAGIRTGGAVSLSAKNALTHLGSVEAVGNITLTGGNISSNILFSDGAINLTATGPIVINGETSARNVVDIKSTGSTLTITSLGPLGGIASTPVINRPEVAIIGPNRIVERPAFVPDGMGGERVAKRKLMNISISCDHRVVDGHDAAAFVQAIKAMIENPARIIAG